MADVRFVMQENCEDEADLLPGLCLLAEQWLGDVALNSFCDSRGSSISLGAWFDKPMVASYLRVRMQYLPRLHLSSKECGALDMSKYVATCLQPSVFPCSNFGSIMSKPCELNGASQPACIPLSVLLARQKIIPCVTAPVVQPMTL